jgi:RNA polymerase sigma-70 factor (ECF subfamily)
MPFLKTKYKKLSDEQLMQFLRRNDTSAFNELYNRYSVRLLHFFLRTLSGDEQKSQDFLQDIFLKIIEKPHLFNSTQNFCTWIFTIARNMCKNEYRKQDVRKIMELKADFDTDFADSDCFYTAGEQQYDRKLFESALANELDQLSDAHRSAFILRYQQQFSIKEIGEILGCSEGTVKSRLFYATRKIAHQLKDFNPYNVEVVKNAKTQ